MTMEQKKSIIAKWLKQLGWILFYFSVFLGCAEVSWHFQMGVIQTISRKWMLLEAGTFGMAWLVWIILWIWCHKNQMRDVRSIPDDWWTKIKENWQILVVLVIAFGQRVWMIGTMQRWDAAEYYYRLGTACTEFNFSATSYLKSFRLCLHPTYGMVLLTAPGEFLNFRGVVGVQICTMILTLAAIFCLYELFEKFYCQMSKGKAAVSALFCACIPLFWGSFAYYNPDYFIALFFIFFVYSEYKKEYISMAFWGIMTSQCKETGIIIIFGYAAFRVLLILFLSKEKWGKRLFSQLKDGANWSAVCVGLSYIVYSVFNGGMSSWKTADSAEVTTFSWNNEGFNCFGFNQEYIVEHLKQLFVMNFAWLFWGLIVLFLLVVVLRRKCVSDLNMKEFSGTVGTVVIYMVFACLYITHPIYRYNVIWAMMTGVIFCIFFHTVTARVSGWKWLVSMGMFTLLVGVQSMFNIDFVSKRTVNTVDTGKNEMLFSSGGSDYYGDYLVYNYEYAWIDRAFDEMMEDAGFDHDTIIYVAGSQKNATQINGFYDRCEIFWDNERKTRTFINDEGTSYIRVYFLDEVQLYDKIDYCIFDEGFGVHRRVPKALVFFIPYYGEDENAALGYLQQYYNISEPKETHDLIGKMIYYEMELKDGIFY